MPQREQQNRIVLIVIVAVLAVIAAGVLIALNAPQTTRPATAGELSGIPQGLDKSGAAALSVGSLDAPVTLTEYGDFSCPHCHNLEPTIHQLVTDYVKSGKLRILFKTVTFVGGPYSRAAALAAVCAAEQNRGWEMHDQIWAFYADNSAQDYSKDTMAKLARTMGLDTAKFAACYDSDSASADVQSVSDEVQAKDVTSTPTLFVNGTRLNYTGPDSLIQAIRTAVEAAQ